MDRDQLLADLKTGYRALEYVSQHENTRPDPKRPELNEILDWDWFHELTHAKLYTTRAITRLYGYDEVEKMHEEGGDE